MTSLTDLEFNHAFLHRHLGPTEPQIQAMLETVKADSIDALIKQIVPADILLSEPLALDDAISEHQALASLQQLADKNKVYRSYIGMGYHDTEVPNVILRNLMENPGWYTAYTPYQPEIAQGRLEALLNYQQMIIDLTGMELANASLLDEATAAAEAMAMARRCNNKNSSSCFFVDELTHPQTIDVLTTRATYYGYELVIGPLAQLAQTPCFAALIQYPGSDGTIGNPKAIIDQLHQNSALAIVATDLMALCLLTAPGTLGADIVLGNSQRFGVPLGFGGPHAAFFATREQYKRLLPGRLIGVSQDSRGRPALRMALQTREQHIRREKATSNICTAQVLLANMAGFYALYHGPEGLTRIAQRIHRLTALLAQGLAEVGLRAINATYFDTLTFAVGDARDPILQRAAALQINLREDSNGNLGVSLNETSKRVDVLDLFEVFTGQRGLDLARLDDQISRQPATGLPTELHRKTDFLRHPVFNRYHSETAMLRYLKQLEARDLTLTHSMIPLGSCTMKLNASAQMMPLSWAKLNRIHPFAAADQTAGYRQLLAELSAMLQAITGFAAISLQPNSGAQGEYAGLLTIRKYQQAQHQGQRDICLIPQSAHGTNPASAQMTGLRVRVVTTDASGNIDLADLTEQIAKAGDRLSCLMITYPSTHGVYEAGVTHICQLVHRAGGQVYMDGANLNAQVGLTQPTAIGADVAHINLHKTFAIPHGGGGPGMGPIGVRAHLAPFLPGHAVTEGNGACSAGAVAASPYGSASILAISWMYMRLLGKGGLKKATEVALLNANYLAQRLQNYYPILYTAANGRIAHECILDLRPLKAATGITEVDIAKRLMDYGFHAPTMSFPVAGTFMIEPTESESKEELDRFAEAMIAIHHEIEKVRLGVWPHDNNPLVNAPHTQADLIESWQRPYSLTLAVAPLPWVSEHKFWPAVNRVDDVWGDRNLFCTCPAIETYGDS